MSNFLNILGGIPENVKEFREKYFSQVEIIPFGSDIFSSREFNSVCILQCILSNLKHVVTGKIEWLSLVSIIPPFILYNWRITHNIENLDEY